MQKTDPAKPEGIKQHTQTTRKIPIFESMTHKENPVENRKVSNFRVKVQGRFLQVLGNRVFLKVVPPAEMSQTLDLINIHT